MLFASLTLEQGIKITLSLWKRVYCTKSGLSVDFPRILINHDKVYLRNSVPLVVRSVADRDSLEQCQIFTSCVLSGTGYLFLQGLSGTGPESQELSDTTPLSSAEAPLRKVSAGVNTLRSADIHNTPSNLCGGERHDPRSKF